ncbi:unnamed protein product [Macrosiphum euphorbiae]|uniref:Uncharacterized protein n=1 Tax=Macrosiphum euphorbiae TaxID=13131 RepID=A0AAV0Y432_9HEMI|nr:unnamed protein product [Macrosiphum euphorbiae]
MYLLLNSVSWNLDLWKVGIDSNGRNEVRTVRTMDIRTMVSVTLSLLTDDDQHIMRRWRDADIVAMVNNMGGMSDARFMAIVAEVTRLLGAATGARAVHRPDVTVVQ